MSTDTKVASAAVTTSGLADIIAVAMIDKLAVMGGADDFATLLIGFVYKAERVETTGRYTFTPTPSDNVPVVALGGTKKSAQMSAIAMLGKDIKRQLQQGGVGIMAVYLTRNVNAPKDAPEASRWVYEGMQIIQDAPSGVAAFGSNGLPALIKEYKKS